MPTRSLIVDNKGKGFAENDGLENGWMIESGSSPPAFYVKAKERPSSVSVRSSIPCNPSRRSAPPHHKLRQKFTALNFRAIFVDFDTRNSSLANEQAGLSSVFWPPGNWGRLQETHTVRRSCQCGTARCKKLFFTGRVLQFAKQSNLKATCTALFRNTNHFEPLKTGTVCEAHRYTAC